MYLVNLIGKKIYCQISDLNINPVRTNLTYSPRRPWSEAPKYYSIQFIFIFILKKKKSQSKVF